MKRKSWKHEELYQFRRKAWFCGFATTEKKNPNEIAANLGVTTRSVKRWLSNFKKKHWDAVEKKPKSGKPAMLSKAQIQQLAIFLEDKKRRPKHGWNYTKIQKLIESEFQVVYKPGSIWRVAKAAGWEYQLPYYKHREKMTRNYIGHHAKNDYSEENRTYKEVMHRTRCVEWKLRKIIK